jgi:DNA-binding beta-propeller fold protein YncE
VAIAPDESFALVTAATKLDPANPKRVVPRNLVSLIDLKANPPRVVDTVSVGRTPESLTVAPDGKHVVVTVMNGSNKPPNSPFLNPNGLAPVYRVDNLKFVKVAEAKVGTWCQGAAWNNKSDLVLVQCMAEREIQMFRFDGSALHAAGAIKVSGGPSGFGTTPPR